MPDKLQPLRGTKDLLPKDQQVFDYIVETARSVGMLYGYQHMSTPLIEYTKVFDRTLGETSDVVSKEIYNFLDKSGNNIALRPEFTACIIRAFITNNLHLALPIKFFSSGPVFRYDRPQAGRQRQFHQVNFEYLGGEGAYTDAETIKLALDILVALEIHNDTTLEINSLGCNETRKTYQQKLLEYFSKYRSELSEDSQRRLEKNPMRILDSKDLNDQKIVEGSPIMSDYYTSESAKYFDELVKYLNLLNIKHIINPRLVRGLDYYCHTAFEFTTTKLGSQSTILAGGRYDNLSEVMGGLPTPAIGFAAGVERLSLMREYVIRTPRPAFVIPIADHNLESCMVLADQLRNQNISTILDNKGKIAKRMQRANQQNARYVIFIGDSEQTTNTYKLKDLDTQQEYLFDFEQLATLLLKQP